jgi:hypothetical protein
VDKQLLRAASIWVHYTTKEDDKRLLGGICLLQFGLRTFGPNGKNPGECNARFVLNLRTQSLI